MLNRWLKHNTIPVMFLMAAATISSVLAGDDVKFSTLYKFQAPDPNTFTSPLNPILAQYWAQEMLFTA